MPVDDPWPSTGAPDGLASVAVGGGDDDDDGADSRDAESLFGATTAISSRSRRSRWTSSAVDGTRQPRTSAPCTRTKRSSSGTRASWLAVSVAIASLLASSRGKRSVAVDVLGPHGFLVGVSIGDVVVVVVVQDGGRLVGWGVGSAAAGDEEAGTGPRLEE
jgi:hypothetical protein